MKIVSMTCPNCGATLQVDADKKNLTCSYCGNNLFIDDEVQHVQYDNAEEAGYQFEKGRLRAQAEATQQNTANHIQYVQQAPVKKRKTWLWILGWITIFPIPLTILLLRKKNMKPLFKYGIIVIAWLLYLVIGFSGASDDSKEKTNKQETSMQETTMQETIDSEVSTEEPIIYAEDVVVNRFITEFNEAYENDIVDITKGNIRTKYFGYVKDVRLEMINANQAAAEAFVITIYGGQAESDRDAMFAVFTDVAKILDSSLTDEIINAAIEDLIAQDVLVENYTIGSSLEITYVPIKELSNGTTKCRIEIYASNYKEAINEALTFPQRLELSLLQTAFISLNPGKELIRNY